MTYFSPVPGPRIAPTDHDGTMHHKAREALILVIEDATDLSDAFCNVCNFLDISVESLPSGEDVSMALRQLRPMAVVARMDARGQDGCHVLMTISAYDPELPVLLITSDTPALLGAIDAVEEIWQLSSVTKWPRLLGAADMVDFLFQAGRMGNCLRLMPL